MPLDPEIQAILSDPDNIKVGVTAEDAIEALDIKQSGQLTAKPISPKAISKPITAGQVLAEQNRPFSKALGAGVSEFTTGLGEAADIGPVSTPLGILRAVNAPAVGFGAATGTTTQNILANVPGLGGPSGVVPSGGAALVDAITQLYTGPTVFKVAARGAKAVMKGIGEIISPGTVREAGIGALAQKFGQPAEFAERIKTIPKSETLFAATKDLPNVPSKDIVKAADTALRKELFRSTPNTLVTRRLKNLVEKYKGGDDALYDDIKEEMQQMALLARGLKDRQPQVAKSLREARVQVLDVVDKISPTLKQANRAYRVEETNRDIIHAARSGNPGNAIKQLFEDDRSIAVLFSKKDIQEIENIADSISDVAGTTPVGGFRQILSAVVEPFAQMLQTPTGRRVLRNTLQGPSETLAKRLTIAVQGWRSRHIDESVAEIMKTPEFTLEMKIEAAQHKDRHNKALEQLKQLKD